MTSKRSCRLLTFLPCAPAPGARVGSTQHPGPSHASALLHKKVPRGSRIRCARWPPPGRAGHTGRWCRPVAAAPWCPAGSGSSGQPSAHLVPQPVWPNCRRLAARPPGRCGAAYQHPARAVSWADGWGSSVPPGSVCSRLQHAGTADHRLAPLLMQQGSGSSYGGGRRGRKTTDRIAGTAARPPPEGHVWRVSLEQISSCQWAWQGADRLALAAHALLHMKSLRLLRYITSGAPPATKVHVAICHHRRHAARRQASEDGYL